MQPLEGIRVLDLTRAMAGPYCTMMLADLGADVIKVERPGSGDESRGWGPPFADPITETGERESAYFIAANRNKRSLTLNLKSPAAKKILHELIQKSDVLVENFRTGVPEKLGFGYATAQATNPMLVYCSISGYGRTGPYAERPGYDVIIQAEGGMMSITGPVEGPPSRVGVPIVDITSGMFAATSILAALRVRGQVEAGQHIDISLFDTQTALLTNVASSYLVGGEPPRRLGNAHPNIAPYEIFRARDRWFVLGVSNEGQWGSFCEALGRNDIKDDVRFITNRERVTNREALVEILAEIFATRDAEDWLGVFRAAGLPCGPINDVTGVFDHPQVQPRDLVVDIEHSSVGLIRLLGFPYKFSRTPAEVRLPPPMLGEHTQEVLQDLLGYSDGELASFRTQGVI